MHKFEGLVDKVEGSYVICHIYSLTEIDDPGEYISLHLSKFDREVSEGDAFLWELGSKIHLYGQPELPREIKEAIREKSERLWNLLGN